MADTSTLIVLDPPITTDPPPESFLAAGSPVDEIASAGRFSVS